MKSFDALTRNASRVLEGIRVTPTKQEVVLEDMFLYIPEHFMHINLAVIGRRTLVYGCHALVTRDGQYAVRNINAMMQINPLVSKTVLIDGVKYLEFFFPKDTVMTVTTEAVKEDTVVYFLFNELFFNGKRPSFMNYSDMVKITDTSGKHAGSGIGSNRKTIQVLAAFLARDPGDYHKEYRFALHDPKYNPKDGFYWAGMKNTFLSRKGVFNKLVANYAEDGITSSLKQTDGVTTPLERVLRQ